MLAYLFTNAAYNNCLMFSDFRRMIHCYTDVEISYVSAISLSFHDYATSGKNINQVFLTILVLYPQNDESPRSHQTKIHLMAHNQI